MIGENTEHTNNPSISSSDFECLTRLVAPSTVTLPCFARDRRLQRNVLSETSSRGASISDGVLEDESATGRSSIQLESVARPVMNASAQLARP